MIYILKRIVYSLCILYTINVIIYNYSIIIPINIYTIILVSLFDFSGIIGIVFLILIL